MATCSLATWQATSFSYDRDRLISFIAEVMKHVLSKHCCQTMIASRSLLEMKGLN